ncbi:MAG: hypothetical protein IJY31_03270, partial [Muribaculaceae bacterium]|nr:hypothetical protein [Muribaculaceae bacterium]
MEKKIMISAVLSVSCFLGNAATVKGVVDGGNSEVVYQVSVSPSDTIGFAPVSFGGIDKEFNVEIGNIAGDVCVTVKSAGYADWKRTIADVDSASVLDLGRILLEKSMMLGEVIVKAPKMNVESDGADYTVRNLSGTIMGNAGNGIDMLRWTPGVIVDNNDVISVIGKGSSEIYINDKKVMNNSELRALSPSNVSKIEIIREPDAKYSSQTEIV